MNQEKSGRSIQMIKVSVVMPVYNAEEYLRQCLDSLVCQTLKEIEIICVDDGSTDQSPQILHEYATKDSRIQIIRQENTGAGEARNKGLLAVKGEYVVFLDCDDFFEKTFLEKTWKAGTEKNADVVLFCARTYDNKTGKYGPEHGYLNKNYLPQKDVFNGSDVPAKIFVLTSPAPWVRLLRTAFIQENQLKFQNLNNTNDFYFTTMSMALAQRICAVQEDFVYYRTNNASSLQGKRKAHNLCFTQAVETVYDDLCARNLFEKYRVSFIHVALGCFRDRIVKTNDSHARAEIYEYMASESFQRMKLLNLPEKEYGSNWLYRLSTELANSLAWYQKNTRQAKTKTTNVVVPCRSKTTPLVSVIIPMYNVEAYLIAALESISKQTLKNIEMICIDDGSSDNTLQIAVDYAKNEPRMSVYHHENSGLSATRNAGINIARGWYMNFFDSDDMLEPDALEILCDQMEKNHLDVALFDASSIRDDGYTGKNMEYMRSMHYEGVCSGPEMLAAMRKNSDYYPCATTYMLRTGFIRKNHLSFHRAILHEDQPFTFQVMLLAKRVAHVNRAFYLRRLHDNSIMTSSVTFANVHGYFYGWKDMQAALTLHEKDLTVEQNMMFSTQLSIVLGSARSNYAALTQGQRFCRYTLGSDEPLFVSVIVKPFDEQQKANNEIANVQKECANLRKQIKDAKVSCEIAALPLPKNNTVVSSPMGQEPIDVHHFAESIQTTKLQPMQTNKAKFGSPMQIQVKSGSFLKRVIKKVAPVTHNRSAFESQLLADLTIRQTWEIMRLQQVLENNSESRYNALRKALIEGENLHRFYEELSKQNKHRDALSAKIDAMLKQYEKQIKAIAAEIDTMNKQINADTLYVADLSPKMDRITGVLESLPAKVDGVSDQINGLPTRIDSVAAKVDIFPDKIDAIAAKVDAVPAKIDAIAARVDAIPAKIDTLATKMDFLPSFFETVTAKLEVETKQMEVLSARVDSMLAKFEAQMATMLMQKQQEVQQLQSIIQKINEDQIKQQQLLQKMSSEQQEVRAIVSNHSSQYMDELSNVLKQVQKLNKSTQHRIAFDHFDIKPSQFSCDVLTSKREQVERIEFSMTPTVSEIDNDSIACALATLCGQGYSNVYLDLPITQKTKLQLMQFTRANWITNGVLPEQEETDQDSQMILNFSGGFDSLAAKALLPDDTNLVAVKFGGWFERESDFFKAFSPYTVTTNFRQLKFDRESWTFVGSGALLYAKALHAKYNVFGTILEASAQQFNLSPKTTENVDVQPFATLGLKDVKLIQGLTEVGTAMVITHYYPDLVNASLKSLAAKGSEKLYRKQVLTDIVCKRYHREIAPIEFQVPNAEKVAIPFGQNFALDFLALYELKYAGKSVVQKTVKDIPEEADDLVHRLTLRFYERLNPVFLPTIPEGIRQGVLDKMRAADIVPYDEEDWAEFQEVKKLLSFYHKELNV